MCALPSQLQRFLGAAGDSHQNKSSVYGPLGSIPKIDRAGSLIRQIPLGTRKEIHLRDSALTSQKAGNEHD
jgi:hypothetical protein